jgi:hypothetical protein
MTVVNSDAIQSSDVARFLIEIESIRGNSNEVSYLDAVVHYCEKRNIEIESIGDFIRKNALLRSKIQEDAESLNYLEKSAQLPI